MKSMIRTPIWKTLGILVLLLALTINLGCTPENGNPDLSFSTKATTESTAPSTSDPVTESASENTDPPTQSTTQPLPPSEETTTEATTVPEEPLPPQTQSPTTAPQERPSDSSFQVHFIDVGQADAALVLCDGEAMLIDGGNAEDSNLLYTYMKKQQVDHLEYVIGTHAHEDHIGGIAGALNYASVDQAYCAVTSYSTKAFNNFVKAVEKHGSTVAVPSPGDRFSLGSADCQIVGVNSTDDTNNSSIVLRVVYGETAFLFTGDAELEAEAVILDQGYDLDATVLKVGHHGSDTSTGYRWLREVDPDYAVISVGKDNSYGHPTQEVLSRLRDAEVTTYRTDLQGDIICTSDGRTVSFRVSRNSDADVFSGIGSNSTQSTQPKPTKPEESEPATQATESSPSYDYVLNTNSKKFHEPSCSSAKKISAKNRQDYHGTREALIQDGYEPCKNCNP